MTYKALDMIVLDRDLPGHGLHKNDLGAIVEVYEDGGLEVEFVSAFGGTVALLALRIDEVRRATDDDLVSVRTRRRSV